MKSPIERARNNDGVVPASMRMHQRVANWNYYESHAPSVGLPRASRHRPKIRTNVDFSNVELGSKNVRDTSNARPFAANKYMLEKTQSSLTF